MLAIRTNADIIRNKCSERKARTSRADVIAIIKIEGRQARKDLPLTEETEDSGIRGRVVVPI